MTLLLRLPLVPLYGCCYDCYHWFLIVVVVVVGVIVAAIVFVRFGDCWVGILGASVEGGYNDGLVGSSSGGAMCELAGYLAGGLGGWMPGGYIGQASSGLLAGR